jgi:hypothetical protein
MRATDQPPSYSLIAWATLLVVEPLTAHRDPVTVQVRRDRHKRSMRSHRGIGDSEGDAVAADVYSGATSQVLWNWLGLDPL